MKIFKTIEILGSVVGVVIFVILAILLVGAILPIPGNYKMLSVLSGSMEPAIHTGSVVIVTPAKDYKIGDIITFEAVGKNGIPTTHRIKEIKNTDGNVLFITKGDANNATDSREVVASGIRGKVLFSIPYLGYVFDFIRRPIGFALLIIIPALLIVWGEAKKIYIELRKSKKVKRDLL